MDSNNDYTHSGYWADPNFSQSPPNWYSIITEVEFQDIEVTLIQNHDNKEN